LSQPARTSSTLALLTVFRAIPNRSRIVSLPTSATPCAFMNEPMAKATNFTVCGSTYRGTSPPPSTSRRYFMLSA
jgi:hypothetical protein